MTAIEVAPEPLILSEPFDVEEIDPGRRCHLYVVSLASMDSRTLCGQMGDGINAWDPAADPANTVCPLCQATRCEDCRSIWLGREGRKDGRRADHRH